MPKPSSRLRPLVVLYVRSCFSVKSSVKCVEGGEGTDARITAPQESGLSVIWEALGNSRGQRAGGVASDQLGLSSRGLKGIEACNGG